MSLSKRDIELIQLGFKCFESPPKVNFEKLASIAGLKNASSAQTCYNGAKRKFLNGAAVATNASSLATGSSTTPKSAPSAPASKKRKTSAKTTTSKPTKGKGGKGSTSATKRHPATNDDDDDHAFDADDDAEDDEEPGHELDLQNVLAYVSDEAAANAADMQLKFDDDARAVKHGAGPTPDNNGDHHALATTNAGEDQAKAEEVERTTVVKTEAEDDDDKGKARDLLRKAIQKAMITSLGNGNEALAVQRDGDFVPLGTVVDLSRQGENGKVLESGTAAGAETVGGVVGAKDLGNADVV